ERHLAHAADEFVRTRADLQGLASSDPEVSRLRRQAEHDLSLGAFGKARAALTAAIALDHDSVEELEARLRERKLSQAATLAVRAGVSRARLDYREAAADFAAAAALALGV